MVRFSGGLITPSLGPGKNGLLLAKPGFKGLDDRQHAVSLVVDHPGQRACLPARPVLHPAPRRVEKIYFLPFSSTTLLSFPRFLKMSSTTCPALVKASSRRWA